MAFAASRPPLSVFPRSSSAATKDKTRQSGEAPRGGLREVLRVLRRDGEFVSTRLRSAAAPLAPLRERLSAALSDLFWLRNLEDPTAPHDPRPPPSSWSMISYPPGLSGFDLLMADLEALKVYANNLHHASKIWSTPLPEVYDLRKVSDYFSCRPHILASRIIEVFLSFASASIRLQYSRSLQSIKKDMGHDGYFGSSEYYIGHLLRESMLNLGPTFIKVGQSLATRPDIIGSEISKALSELHEKIPPFPRAIAMKIIEEEFGCPVQYIFSYISEEPVAAASFGQVYQGCTVDGHMVAVKVQRPNLLHTVVRDIYILRLGLALLRKIAKRRSDPCLYADELGKGLVGELDYTLEASNALEFMEAHSHYSFMMVPKVFRHLTRKRVLTMELMIGENPNDLLSLSKGSSHAITVSSKRQQHEAKKRLLDLVNKGVEASLVQLLETGLLHADPHPGNLRYMPGGCIGFLDFGLLCRMEKKHQLAMLASIIHIVNEDWGGLVYDLTEMNVVRRDTNLHHVTMDLEDALGEVVFRDGIPDIKFSRVLGKIWSVALKYHFRMPPYYTLVLRSLASLEGLALAADPGFKTFKAAYPYVVRKLLFDNSADTRKILYSVVFNKRREFQWQKMLLFLKLVSMRRDTSGLSMLSTSKSPKSSRIVQEEVYEVAGLLLKLLPSKDGAVLRRLLMTADPVSLARAVISNDAFFFRKHVSTVLADLIFQWMIEAVRGCKTPNQYDHFMLAKAHNKREMGHSVGTSLPEAKTVLRDRRLKVIFYRVLNSIRRNPILMLRVCWSSITIFMTSFVLALHHLLVYWSETYLTSLTLVPKRFAVGV